MKFFKCGKCDKMLEEKYAINHPKSEITWYNADEHEERIKKVEEIEGKGNEEKLEEEKKKRLESYRADLDDMDRDELDDLLQSLRAEIHELRKKLNPETDENEQSKQASVEFIGVDTYHSVRKDGDDVINELQTLQIHRKKKLKHSQSYSVLTLDQGHNTASGDSLLQRMGSVNQNLPISEVTTEHVDGRQINEFAVEIP